MTDESKAVGEVAKASGKAVDAGRELGGFISKYVGGPLDQAMGIVEDKLKYLRWERQIRLMERANEFLTERGLQQPTRKVPMQIAIPIMQGGSLEEDDLLQDRWAALLVNAADESSDAEVRRAFISILEDLSPLDANVLEKIYDFSAVPQDKNEVWTTYLPDKATGTKPETEDLRPLASVELSLGNLARLGLISSAMAWGGMAILSCVHRTVLGHEFLRAIKHGSGS
jgi:hypothetical protein